MEHVVIGAGEVGTAIATVLNAAHRVFLRDIENLGPQKADVLHICFPYGSDFCAQVASYQAMYEPSLTIIHSTVPVGISDTLGAVHSPVTGKHPNLALSILTFEKFFGGPQAEEAAEIFRACQVTCAVRPSARDTEAGKLWELAQYGLAIAIEKHIHAYCQEYELDFDTVYTDFAVRYNAGYLEMEHAEFVRPIIKHMPGPIGGHCVVQGSRLLNDPLVDLVEHAGVNEVLSVANT